LLELGHAHVALGLVVVEGDMQVGNEAQYIVAFFAEAFDEVVGRILTNAPATAGFGRAGGIACLGDVEDGIVTCLNVKHPGSGQCGESTGAGLDGQSLGLAEQRDPNPWPKGASWGWSRRWRSAHANDGRCSWHAGR